MVEWLRDGFSLKWIRDIFLGQINEDDEKLLEEETASPANLKRYFPEIWHCFLLEFVNFV